VAFPSITIRLWTRAGPLSRNAVFTPEQPFPGPLLGESGFRPSVALKRSRPPLRRVSVGIKS